MVILRVDSAVKREAVPGKARKRETIVKGKKIICV